MQILGFDLGLVALGLTFAAIVTAFNIARGRRILAERRKLAVSLGLTLDAKGQSMGGSLGEVTVSVKWFEDDDNRERARLSVSGMPKSLGLRKQNVIHKFLGRPSEEAIVDVPFLLSGHPLDQAVLLDATLLERAEEFIQAGFRIEGGSLAGPVDTHDGEAITAALRRMKVFVASAQRARGDIKTVLIEAVRRRHHAKSALQTLLDHCPPSAEIQALCASLAVSFGASTQTLARIGAANVKELRAIVLDPALDANHRARALKRLLHMISDLDAWLQVGVEQAVLSMIETDDDATLVVAARALGKYGSTAAVEPLRLVLNRKERIDAATQIAAQKAIAKIQSRVHPSTAGGLAIIDDPGPSGTLSFASKGGEVALTPSQRQQQRDNKK